MREATVQQLKVLRFISSFREEHSYPPTIREIAAGFGWGSTNSVACHLRFLDRKGLLTNQDYESRTLVLTAKGFAALGILPTTNNNLPRPAPERLEIAFAEETP